MKERVIRGIAGGFSLLLMIVYLFFPVVEEAAFSDSGREKWELIPGERYQWKWSPVSGNLTAIDLSLSGIKKAAGTTVTVQVQDENGKAIASTQETIMEPFEGQDRLRLEGSFSEGKTYTLAIQSGGDPETKGEN